MTSIGLRNYVVTFDDVFFTLLRVTCCLF